MKDKSTKGEAAPKKITLITGAIAITKAIESIASRGKKLDADMHVAACSALAHHAEHGDTSLLIKLVDAMPKSGRKNAVLLWAAEFGKVRIENGKIVHDGQKTARIPEAMANPFFEFIAEPPLPVFNLDQALASLLKRAEAAASDDGENAGKHAVNPALLSQLKALVPSTTLQ